MNKFTEQALRGEPNDLRNLQPTPSPTRQVPLALPVSYSAYRASLKDANGNLIGLLHDPEHAKAIVAAVNSHSALKAACEAALALAGKGEERGC
jgi:hypothetical protein